jgi:hypothetical protein
MTRSLFSLVCVYGLMYVTKRLCLITRSPGQTVQPHKLEYIVKVHTVQEMAVKSNHTIAILLQRPVYCFWRADFHGQGATRVTPDNFM